MDVQVLDHAETVKQLSQQEGLVTELQQQQAAHEASGQAAHKAQVCCLGSMGINVVNQLCYQLCCCNVVP